MPLLQAATSFIYTWVQHSWIFATVAVKYVLVANVLELAYRNELEIEDFVEIVESRAPETVTGIAGIGLFMSLLDAEISAFAPVVSEFIALVYFGFLFWRY